MLILSAGLLINFKQTAQTFASVILPFALFTVVSASIAVQSSDPGELRERNLSSDISWAAYGFRFAKIAGVTLSVSLLVGSLPPSGLYRWLVGLGISKAAAFQIASPLIIVQSLAHQLRTIFDARLAQGYVGTRSYLSMGKQRLPILTVLIASGLNTALERSDVWRQDDIISLLEKDNSHIQSHSKHRWIVSFVTPVSAFVVLMSNMLWSHF